MKKEYFYAYKKATIDVCTSGKDVYTIAAEGAVAGLITGLAIDGTVAATIATGGGALAVVGTGAAGGAVGAVAGDVTGQVVTSVRSEASLNISTDNFASKAATGAISGSISGLTSGTVGILENAASKSTQAILKEYYHTKREVFFHF